MSAHRNRPLTLALVIAVVVLAACSSTPSGQRTGSPSSPSASPTATAIDKTKAMSTAETAEIDKAANDFLTTSPDKSPGLWLAVWDPAKGYYEQAYGATR